MSDPLALDEAELRRLTHWVADQVVDHLVHGDDGPALAVDTPTALHAALGGPVPTGPGDPQAAMQVLVDVALATMQHVDHRRFFTRVPGPASAPAILGDWLATGFQSIAASWGGGSGPTTVELVVLDWLRELLGLPEGTEGVLLSGGSMANVTGLLAARHELGDDVVVILSDQTHSSIGRGLAATGFRDVRVLPTGDRLRLTVDQVASAVDDRPSIVVATAGTTNTGAVDPLAGLAEVCDWLHVDGAYGAPAHLARPIEGLDRADSLVLDPHKWLFQPYDLGVLLVRRPGALERTFTMNPEYLADIVATEGEVDLRNRSLELSRRSRAIKLWLTFRTYGVDKLAAAIEQGLANAEQAQAILEEGAWEIVTPAQLGIVTFAHPEAPADAHLQAAAAITASGYAAVSTTTLNGRTVLRLCTINPRTTEADLRETISRLAELLSRQG